MQQFIRNMCRLAMLVVVLGWSAAAFAQGVTTGSISGVVKDAQGLAVPGATVTAKHEPSGSSYEAVANENGRFTMPALRVGGPYTVTAALAGFQSTIRKDIFVTLGVGTDLNLKLETVAMTESVTVTAQAADAVFSSTRTGAATSVLREELQALPTVSGRINDMTRMSPQ